MASPTPGPDPTGTESPASDATKLVKEEPGQRVEVALASGEIRAFASPKPISSAPSGVLSITEGRNSASSLRDAILSGAVTKELRVRNVSIDPKGTRTESPWVSIEKFASGNPNLRNLYRPVWHHAIKFAGYGALAGIALKAVDTTILLFSVDGRVGFAWLVVVASLFFTKKWPWAPIGAAILVSRAGISANLFVTVFATAIVGGAFGTPAGMVIGTVVGHFRSASVQRPADAGNEGTRPYLLGIALPLVALGALVPTYLWLNFKLFDWMGNR